MDMKGEGEGGRGHQGRNKVNQISNSSSNNNNNNKKLAYVSKT